MEWGSPQKEVLQFQASMDYRRPTLGKLESQNSLGPGLLDVRLLGPLLTALLSLLYHHGLYLPKSGPATEGGLQEAHTHAPES